MKCKQRRRQLERKRLGSTCMARRLLSIILSACRYQGKEREFYTSNTRKEYTDYYHVVCTHCTTERPLGASAVHYLLYHCKRE